VQEPPIPPDEEQRLALLKACNIMYTPAEEAFDDVARLASELCDAEIALITLVDSDYQWFKAKVGVELPGLARDLSFCGHCITGAQPMVIEDTHEDPRFADNPLVTGYPGIRFYAGVPLEVDEGSAVGALSVAGRAPRSLSARELESLKRLAKQISRELRLRRDLGSAHVSMPPSAAPLEPGAIVGGKWQVSRLIGRGATGAVYEAFDGDRDRAAIKVLLPMWRSFDEVVERFAREARVLMRLKSPHVGKLLDVGNLDKSRGDLPFLVLEFLEGTDLLRIIERDGRVPVRQALGWVADACDGVAEAHELGVVHRDLKPSNVFLADAPNAPVVKVLDFGIATSGAASSDPKLTRQEGTIGSPAYMSPEQMTASSDVDARSDVWSMGALLYEAITGQLPFPGSSNLQIFASALSRPPLPLSAHLTDVPAGVESILQKCLARSRDDRYATMNELSVALRHHFDGAGSNRAL
jgi:serine/threonine-protein kinase